MEQLIDGQVEVRARGFRLVARRLRTATTGAPNPLKKRINHGIDQQREDQHEDAAQEEPPDLVSPAPLPDRVKDEQQAANAM